MLNYHSGFVFKQVNLLTDTDTPESHTSEVSGLCLQSVSSVCIWELSLQGLRLIQ